MRDAKSVAGYIGVGWHIPLFDWLRAVGWYPAAARMWFPAADGECRPRCTAAAPIPQDATVGFGDAGGPET